METWRQVDGQKASRRTREAAKDDRKGGSHD